MKRERRTTTTISNSKSSRIHNLMCTPRVVGLVPSLLLITMISSNTIHKVHGFHIHKMTPSSISHPKTSRRSSSTLRASLRDLLNDDDHPKNKRPNDDDDDGGFFSKIHNDGIKNKSTGFPSRSSKRVLTEEEEEMGQHVDQLGTFSFSAGSGVSGSGGVVNRHERRLGGNTAAAVTPTDKDVKDDATSEIPNEENDTTTNTKNTIMPDDDDELSPDNYNNRGVFLSRHKYPKEPRVRSVAGGIRSNVSTRDNHDGALDTFSFASSSAETTSGGGDGVSKSSTSNTNTNKSTNEMAGGKQGVSSKTLFPDSKMDRLGTFSLAKTPMVDSIGPSVSTRTDRNNDNDDKRRGTYSLANNEPTTATANYIGPYVPSTKTDAIGNVVENVSADNHGDRMSTFSFASATPKSSSSGSGSSSTDIQQQGL
eukprot:scaffold140955_cov22-Cyclotella_meneghiniana.AAC.1